MSNEQNWTPGTLTVARIVDCVNAFEGIPNPAAYIGALRECVKALETIADTEPDPNNMQRFHDIAETALARIKGSATS